MISDIFNLPIYCGTLPSWWKTSAIIHFHEKGSRCDPANCRQINPILMISRNLRRLSMNSLIVFLLELELINTRQYGFFIVRSRINCVTGCLKAITKVPGHWKVSYSNCSIDCPTVGCQIRLHPMVLLRPNLKLSHSKS